MTNQTNLSLAIEQLDSDAAERGLSLTLIDAVADEFGLRAELLGRKYRELRGRSADVAAVFAHIAEPA